MTRRYAATLLASLASLAQAQTPTFRLDPHFGSGGVATYEWPLAMGYQWNAANAWATPLADGRWVVMAQLRNGTAQTAQVNWFEADGQVTPPMPGAGPYTPFGMGGWNAAGIVQSYGDGSLTLLTTTQLSASDLDFRLWRTRSNGQGDGYTGCAGSFARNIAFDLAPPSAMADIAGALLQDNAARLVMAGTAEAGNGQSRLVLARTLGDCGTDDGFGSANGRVTVPIGDARRVRVHTATFDLQARILVGGGYTRESGSNPDGRCLIARLTEHGQVDAAFGSNGIVSIDNVSEHDGKWRCDVTALQVDHVGRIYAHGAWKVTDGSGSAQRAFLLRYLPTGQRDPSFRTNPWGIHNSDHLGGGLALFESDGVAVTAFSEQVVGQGERARGEIALIQLADGHYASDDFMSRGNPLGHGVSSSFHRIVPAGPDAFYLLATSGPDLLSHHRVHLIRYRRSSTIPTEPSDRLFANGFQ